MACRPASGPLRSYLPATSPPQQRKTTSSRRRLRCNVFYRSGLRFGVRLVLLDVDCFVGRVQGLLSRVFNILAIEQAGHLVDHSSVTPYKKGGRQILNTAI